MDGDHHHGGHPVGGLGTTVHIRTGPIDGKCGPGISDMEIYQNLATGFVAAATPINLLFCLFGCLIGTLIGVLPGIGPIATIAMLLPMTFGLSPLGALIMLAGIYYGARSTGGSTTAILLLAARRILVGCYLYRRLPDGAKGPCRLGPGRCCRRLFLRRLRRHRAHRCFCADPRRVSPSSFCSPEYFALMLFGLLAAVILANGSIIKVIAMVILGLLFGLVGTELQSGVARFTFGVPELYDGVDFVPVAMGLFGFAEIMTNLDRKEGGRAIIAKISSLMPTRDELRRSIPAVLRGTGVGSLFGILPGGGAVLSSFAAYTLEKKISKTPAEFGQGAIEGVASPESANNAGAQTSFIPLLTLGISSTPVMAIMMGAMTI